MYLSSGLLHERHQPRPHPAGGQYQPDPPPALHAALINPGSGSFGSGPPPEAGGGPVSLLRPHQAQLHLGALLRRQQQRDPEKAPQHGGEDLRLLVRGTGSDQNPDPAERQV